jgi:8-oxo-dGTP pyrophosphatase MutT (NUDIX family)
MKLPVPVRRVAYRAAYRGLRTYWFIRRPELHGVKCAVIDHDRVLLVRHTYGPRHWDLPGGTMRRGEPPINAARREMAEELGIAVEDWQAVGELRVTAFRKRDVLHCFQAELSGRTISIDLGELAVSGWFDRRSLPHDLGPFVEPILALMSSVCPPR